MENKFITTDGYEIENLNPQIATLKPLNTGQPFNGFDGNYLVMDFGNKTANDIIICSFKISGDFEINGASAGCGCTVPTYQKVDGPDKDKNYYVVNVNFDNKRVEKNLSKTVTLILDGNKRFRINVIMNHS